MFANWIRALSTRRTSPIVTRSTPRVHALEERTVPTTMFAVNDANGLVRFDSATPGTLSAPIAITGLQPGESVQGLDVRPATGQLYALGVTLNGDGTSTGRIYTLDRTTAAATAVGAAPFSTSLAESLFWGFDFNPVVDRIRIINDASQNLRVNPNDGTLAATDTSISVIGLDTAAYDRNYSGSATTTLFTYDFDGNRLATIGGIDGAPSPNGGVVTDIGTSGIVADPDPQQFDIEAGTSIARLATAVGGVERLYTVNLTTGAATLVGAIGTGTIRLNGMTSEMVVVNGTASDDTIVVRRDGANTSIDVTTGGTTTTQTFSGFGNPIVVNAQGGNDSVTVRPEVTAPTVLVGGAGSDSLTGGSGNDILVGGTGADVLNGGAGLDTTDYAADTAGVSVNLTYQSATGGDATGDTISSIENINGGSGVDTLFGDNLLTGNVIYGGGGNDVIFALDGDDVVGGGAGNDQIDAGKGNDLLTGGEGNDVLLGRGGNDSIFGGAGNDLLTGEQGADRMNGGLGADSINGGTGSDTFVVNFSEATGTGGTSDTYFGGAESDTFEVRGVTKVVGGVTVIDPVKTAAMDAYFLSLQTAGQTDLNTTVDAISYTLLDEAPL